MDTSRNETTRFCALCLRPVDRPLVGRRRRTRRIDAEHCSNACRQKAWRYKRAWEEDNSAKLAGIPFEAEEETP